MIATDLGTPIPSARQLKAIRLWLGLSQAEFGEKAGVSLSVITNYETETVKSSTDSKIAIGRYIAGLGIEFNEKGGVVLEQ